MIMEMDHGCMLTLASLFKVGVALKTCRAVAAITCTICRVDAYTVHGAASIWRRVVVLGFVASLTTNGPIKDHGEGVVLLKI